MLSDRVTYWTGAGFALQVVPGHCFALVLCYCFLFIAGCPPESRNFPAVVFLTFSIQLNFLSCHGCDYNIVDKYGCD